MAELSAPTPNAGDGIAAIVVAYRSSGTIRECLSALAGDPRVIDVVVVDNSRDSETEQVVASLASALRVTYLPSANLGFAKGCNYGAERAAESRWLAFVNPDLVVTRSLGELADIADRIDATLISANVSTNPRFLSARHRVTRARELLSAAFGPSVYPLRAGREKVAETRRVGQVLGALMVVRTSDFRRWAGFDERFELYYDDVDLSDQANDENGCYFVTANWGRHAGGVSAEQSASIAYVVGPVSRVRYLRKRFPGRTTELFIPLLALTDFFSRTVGRSREGAQVRRRRLRAQLDEWRSPGSVSLLR